MQYRQRRIISGRGTSPDRFASTLRSITVDRHGHVYAAGDSEIKVFDSAGHLKRRWSTARPVLSVAVADDGSIYAGELRQIEIFDSAGKLLDTWRDEKYLGRVTQIGFVQDSVLAGDAADRVIRRFNRHGRFLNNIGKDNSLNGLATPNGMVAFGVDAHGIVHVANPGKHRVERYTPEGQLLGYIGHFDGVDPAGFTGCCNPTNVAVGEAIYVTEKGGPRAKVYDFSGKLLAVIATDVFDANCKNMSIAADAYGSVYVADTVKLEIFVFEPIAA